MANVERPKGECAHCGVPIVDPTTRAIDSEVTYCCPNCAAAMQQRGSGSDPHTRQQRDNFHCARCGCPIVHEASMETRGDRAYCCGNCAAAAESEGGRTRTV